jgi:hypothetical protein
MSRTRALFALLFTARVVLITLGIGFGILGMPRLAMAQQDIVDDEYYDLSDFCDEDAIGACYLESTSIIFATSSTQKLDVYSETYVSDELWDEGLGAWACVYAYQDSTQINSGCAEYADQDVS